MFPAFFIDGGDSDSIASPESRSLFEVGTLVHTREIELSRCQLELYGPRSVLGKSKHGATEQQKTLLK